MFRVNELTRKAEKEGELESAALTAGNELEATFQGELKAKTESKIREFEKQLLALIKQEDKLKKLKRRDSVPFVVENLTGDTFEGSPGAPTIASKAGNYFGRPQSQPAVADLVVRDGKIFKEDAEEVELRLILEADPNLYNHEGRTPLMNCIKENYDDALRLTELFVKNKYIAINSKSKNPNDKEATALHIACSHDVVENVEIVRLILGNIDVNVNAKDKFGMTALHYAAKNGYLSLVKALIENGTIDPNVRSSSAQVTAAMLAQEEGHKECLIAILKFDKTNPDIKNKKGKSVVKMITDKDVMAALAKNNI